MKFTQTKIEESDWTAARQAAAWAMDHYGLHHQSREDLIQVGITKIAQAKFAKGPQTTAYMRQVAKNVLIDHVADDRRISIPRETARDMIKRGQPVPTFAFEQPPEDDGFDPFVSRSLADEWNEIFDLYNYLYSLCRNDRDRDVLEAAWDNGESIYSGPVDRELIARNLGLPLIIVNATLDILEDRYHQQSGRLPWCDFNRFCRIRQIPRDLRPRIQGLAPEVLNWGRFLTTPRVWADVPRKQVPLYFLGAVRSHHTECLDLLAEIAHRLVVVQHPWGYAHTAIKNLHKQVA